MIDELSRLTREARERICRLLYNGSTSDESYLTDEARYKYLGLTDSDIDLMINGLIEDGFAPKWIKSIIFDGSNLTKEARDTINRLLTFVDDNDKAEDQGEV